MLVGYHSPQLVFQLLLCEALFISSYVVLWNDDVHPVGAIADMSVNPVKLFTQLVNVHKSGAQYAKAARLTHCNHHVAAVSKGEDGGFYTDIIAEGCAHYADLISGPSPQCRARFKIACVI